MKFDELFPRSKFPLRAKTKVSIPDTDLVMRVSVFYQKPLFSFDNPQQTCGICRIVFYKKEELMAEAVLVEKNSDHPRVFTCKWGDWVDITDDDHEVKQMCELEKLLLEPKFIGHPFAGLDDAEWKQF